MFTKFIAFAYAICHVGPPPVKAGMSPYNLYSVRADGKPNQAKIYAIFWSHYQLSLSDISFFSFSDHLILDF